METEKLIQNILDGKQNIEVVENGKSVTNPRIDPAVMSFIMQASQLAQIVKIRKYFDDRTSHGLIQTYDVTVTDELKEIKVDFPAQSFSLFNDGADTVNVWVNDLGRPKRSVKSNEALNLNYETHKIKYIYLQCASGQSASIRIVAKD
jgi:hypothetical protein